jgi:hypothetical protein
LSMNNQKTARHEHEKQHKSLHGNGCLFVLDVRLDGFALCTYSAASERGANTCAISPIAYLNVFESSKNHPTRGETGCHGVDRYSWLRFSSLQINRLCCMRSIMSLLYLAMIQFHVLHGVSRRLFGFSVIGIKKRTAPKRRVCPWQDHQIAWLYGKSVTACCITCTVVLSLKSESYSLLVILL